MRELSYKETKRLLERAVEDKGGDYVYRGADDEGGCQYFKEGKPSCLVGHVLNYLGVSPDQVTEGETAGDELKLLGFELDSRTELLVNKAQRKQDLGYYWDEAVRSAVHITDYHD